MKTAAVICEFNPFHNGHAYILNKARELTGADYVIAIMSGNYVQRGEPAIFDKYRRTELALNCGADLVIELPQVFAMASAMEFARAGVLTAVKTGVTDFLVFGTESNANADELKTCADYLLNEDSDFQQSIKKHLKSGLSYPAARELAFSEVSELDSALLRTSNNILALSYIGALNEAGSSIVPVPVTRQGDGYNETETIDDCFASATALRALIKKAIAKGYTAESICSEIADYIPPQAADIYSELIRELLSDEAAALSKTDRLACILNYRLIRELAKSEPDLSCYCDVSKEISDRLLNTANSFGNMSDRVLALKTRQYTYSRIQRALLHIVLDVKDEEVERKKAAGYVEYLRVLGFRRDASPLLKAIKQSPLREDCPMITNAADFRELLREDIMRDNIYYSLDSITGKKVRNEFERRIVIV